jgi:hypothetical protein
MQDILDDHCKRTLTMTSQAVNAPPRTIKWTEKVARVRAAVLSLALLPFSANSSAAETALLQPQEQFEQQYVTFRPRRI